MMKIILMLSVVLFYIDYFPVQAALVPYNATTMQYAVTPDQAMTIARTWSGNPSISLSLAGVNVSAYLPGYEEYIYRSSDHQTFEVKCNTGWLWWWSNGIEHQNYQASLDQNQQTTLTQSQIEQTAYAFARSHYPNFDALQMQELSYVDGVVVFYSKTANGVWFKGNACAISMNTFDGQPWGYTAATDTGGVTVSTTASLSASQAETNAVNWLLTSQQPAGGDPVLSAFTTQPSELWVVQDDLGQQCLVWIVYAAKSVEKADYTYPQWVQNNYDFASSCEIGIDANTGAVATYEEWLGGKKPLKPRLLTWHSRNESINSVSKHSGIASRQEENNKVSYPHLSFQMNGDNANLIFSPVKVSQHPYFYAGYLSYGTPKTKVTFTKEKLVVFRGPGRQVRLHLNSQTYQVNGQTKQMSAKPVLINGRCYVPLDVMQAVLGGKWRYEAKAQTVRYDPPQVKQASK